MANLILLLLTLSFAMPDQGGESAGGRGIVDQSGYTLVACTTPNGSVDQGDGGDTDLPTPQSYGISATSLYPTSYRFYPNAPHQVKVGTSVIRAPPLLS
jgi:hypothetical protein